MTTAKILVEADNAKGYVCQHSVGDKMSEATLLITATNAGDSKAAEELLVLVYDELRRLAASKLAHEAPGQTLQPTALVHEAWLRLVGNQNPSFNNREHFFPGLR